MENQRVFNLLRRVPVPVGWFDELLPWHIQYWRLGIVTWHGWVVEHEYILHRAFFGGRVGRLTGWMDAGVKSRGRWPTGPAPKLPSHIVPTPGAQLVFGFDPVWRPQPLWMYFLITTQPCLKSGQGSDCRRVQVLVQGSKVSMLPRAGPSLLTMPPVA